MQTDQEPTVQKADLAIQAVPDLVIEEIFTQTEQTELKTQETQIEVERSEAQTQILIELNDAESQAKDEQTDCSTQHSPELAHIEIQAIIKSETCEQFCQSTKITTKNSRT